MNLSAGESFHIKYLSPVSDSIMALRALTSKPSIPNFIDNIHNQLMSISVQLQIGDSISQADSKTTTLSLSLKQTDVSETYSHIKSLVTQTSVPHLAIKIPKTLARVLSSQSPLGSYLQRWKIVTRQQTIEGQTYLFGTYNEQITKFISKLQHLFKEISKLDNFLHIQVYQSKHKNSQQAVLSNALIKIEGQIDKQSTGVIKRILKQVSPGFLNSPLIAILQLFVELECQIQLNSIEQLPAFLKLNEELQSSRQPKSQFISQLEQSGQQLEILFCIPNLFSVSGKATPSLLSLLLKN